MDEKEIALAKEVIVPLLTLLLSGVVATLVTYWLAKLAQRRELLRTKLEEAYMACDTFCRSLGMHYLSYFPLYKGEVSLAEHNDFSLDRGTPDDVSAFRRLEMVVHIYATSALPAYNELLSVRDELAKLRVEHRSRYLGGETSTPDLVPRLNDALARIDVAERSIKKAITKAARRL
jgi:hypothetical protein